MTKLERIDRAMNRIEAASKAADRVLDAMIALEADEVFELTERRSKQCYRMMQFWGLLLRDLSNVQDLLLMEMQPPASESARVAA